MTADNSRGLKWPSRINRGLAVLSGIAIALMMLVGGVDVISTNLDKIGLESRPLPAMTEFVSTMMVFGVFLAIPLAQQRRGHIQVELLTSHMSPGWKRLTSGFNHILSGLLFSAIALYGWHTTAHAWKVNEFAAGAFDLPLWPARFALALGSSVMTLQCLLDLAGEIYPSLREANQSDVLIMH